MQIIRNKNTTVNFFFYYFPVFLAIPACIQMGIKKIFVFFPSHMIKPVFLLQNKVILFPKIIKFPKNVYLFLSIFFVSFYWNWVLNVVLVLQTHSELFWITGSKNNTLKLAIRKSSVFSIGSSVCSLFGFFI